MTSSPGRRKRRSVHAHKLIAETARVMAHELYDQLMLDNDHWQVWKDRYPDKSAKQLEEHFVYLTVPGLLGQARAALGAMLATPIDDALKDTILEALILDNTLGKGRKTFAN